MSRQRDRFFHLPGRLRGSLYAALALALFAPTAVPVDAPSSPVEPSAEIDLEAVIVKQRRERRDTVAEKIRKAMTPKDRGAADLDHASPGMRKMAGWLGEADSDRRSPSDRSREALAPPGDETEGCGADLNLGCKPQR